MIGERTPEGLEVRLRTRDPGRYFSAAFLAVWLCGWAAGEAFAIWFLTKGAIALLTGTPPDPGREPLQWGPAAMVGAFLLLWLAFWTFGGIAAIGELLRLLWGEDRIVATADRLTVTWARGPFRSSRSFERDAIRRIVLSSPRDHLLLDSGAQRIELSRLGGRPERREAAAALSTELAIAEAPDAAGRALPDRWEEIVTPEGERALVPKLATRRKQAQVASLVTMGAAAVTVVITRDIARDPNLAVPALLGLVVTAALAWGAIWLARGRREWRIGSGSLTLRQRYGSSVRDLFEARRLVLDSSTDSDGDVWYELYAVGDAEVPAAKPPVVRWNTSGPPNSRSIARIMSDATTVRGLAAWLSREARLELEDRTTAAAQAMTLTQLRETLEQSGRFGRFAAKLVDRLAKDRERTG